MKLVTDRTILLIVILLGALACNSNCGGRRPDSDGNVNSTDPGKASPSPAKGAVSASGASVQANILFIIDSSGSMKAKAGGKTKMDVAKEVVNSLIGELPTGTNAGLMAYGHRAKDDCKDVELLVPIGPVKQSVFAEKVNALQPIGQTPISFSIGQAVDAFKGVSGRKTIILISDGEETCKEDPCAVAADLKRADVDLQMHVVGFGIDSEAAKKQLRCIAEAGGGTYQDAGDSEQLKQKLKEVAESAAGNFTSLIQNMNGESLRYRFSFFKPGAKDSDEPIDSTLDLGQQLLESDRVLSIPPGTYDIRFTSLFGPVLWKRNVGINAGQMTRVEFERFGRVRISITDQNGQAVRMWTEVRDGAQEELDLIGDHRFKETIDLPAGTYNLKFWGEGADETWRRGVVVRSGAETAVDVKVTR